MKFGPVAVRDAEGTILAHSVQAGKSRLKKGLRLDSESVLQLLESGLEEVIVARPDADDVDENAAAEALANAFAAAGETAIEIAPPGTGRVNLHAGEKGLFRADRALVDAFNAIDPAITFACLADRAVVDAGDMVGTIKIIPLAVPRQALERACTAIAATGFARLLPFRPHRAAMVATRLPTLKPKVMEKTRALTAERLAAYGSHLDGYAECAHDADALAGPLAQHAEDHDLLIVFGASAVTDPDDVIPAAIRKAGGTVTRVGMPVDPGNLLVLGEIGGKPVIGAPGCARSPKENGFDWVLARILAGAPPSAADIGQLGVGGLLTEIPTRPQPRAQTAAPRREQGVGIVLLAAGRASRMGEGTGHKLLAEFDGQPLVRRMAERALASAARQVVAVTGHRAEQIRRALSGLGIVQVENPDFTSGMASSLKAGLGALAEDLSGVMILLADMPGLTRSHLDRLIAAFEENAGEAIVRACDGDIRGNPVILPAAMRPELGKLEGDVGARALIESAGFPVVDIDIGPAARLDVDTPEAVRAAGGRLQAEAV